MCNTERYKVVSAWYGWKIIDTTQGAGGVVSRHMTVARAADVVCFLTKLNQAGYVRN